MLLKKVQSKKGGRYGRVYLDKNVMQLLGWNEDRQFIRFSLDIDQGCMAVEPCIESGYIVSVTRIGSKSVYSFAVPIAYMLLFPAKSMVSLSTDGSKLFVRQHLEEKAV